MSFTASSWTPGLSPYWVSLSRWLYLELLSQTWALLQSSPLSSGRQTAPRKMLRLLPWDSFPFSVSSTQSSSRSVSAYLTQTLASPGFLNLLTPSSTLCLLALFHASSAHGVFPSELCSPHAAVLCFHSRCPLVVGRMRRPYAAFCANVAKLHIGPTANTSPSGLSSTWESATLNGFLHRQKRVALLGFVPPGFSPSPELHSLH